MVSTGGAVSIPAELLAEMAADLAAGSERAARWQPAVDVGARVCASRGGRAFTGLAAHLWPIVDEVTMGNEFTLTVDTGVGGLPFWEADAWVPMGSSADPESPRPTKGDRVLMFWRSAKGVESVHVGEMVGEDEFHPGTIDVLTETLVGMACAAVASRWAILPAPWTGETLPAPVSGGRGRDAADRFRLFEAAARAVFEDERLWYRFTDRYAHLGGPGDARRAIVGVVMGVVEPVLAELTTDRARLAAEVEHYRQAAVALEHAVTAALGVALGYAPDGTGDHTATTLAGEAALRIGEMSSEVARLRAALADIAGDGALDRIVRRHIASVLALGVVHRDGDVLPCCGMRRSLLPGGAWTSTDDRLVTCAREALDGAPATPFREGS